MEAPEDLDNLERAFMEVDRLIKLVCPDNHARKLSQAGSDQMKRFARLSIDQAKTEPQVLIPGALKRTC